MKASEHWTEEHLLAHYDFQELQDVKGKHRCLENSPSHIQKEKKYRPLSLWNAYI